VNQRSTLHFSTTRFTLGKMVVPKTNNEAGRRSFVVQGALIFNSLSADLRKENSYEC